MRLFGNQGEVSAHLGVIADDEDMVTDEAAGDQRFFLLGFLCLLYP